MNGYTVEHEVPGHEPHWETSPWPLVLSMAMLFVFPFAFSLYFVYGKPIMAIVSLGDQRITLVQPPALAGSQNP